MNHYHKSTINTVKIYMQFYYFMFLVTFYLQAQGCFSFILMHLNFDCFLLCAVTFLKWLYFQYL